MTDTPLSLRGDAETLAAPFPALLAAADQLAATVQMGEHGRRRAGAGDTFWQYRPAQPHDARRHIDWRRSARSDAQFVRETEWQVAQSVMLWVDNAASMGFSSHANLPTKSHRARLLALATAILLHKGGERVGLTGNTLPPRRGDAHLRHMAELLCRDEQGEYGAPDASGLPRHARALFFSDFLGDFDVIEAAVTKAAENDTHGALVQVLDPTEESFPFQGRTIFESMGGGLTHETLKASDLRDRYLERLAQRKDQLATLARHTGWHLHSHHTDQSAATALLWAFTALEQTR